MRTKEQVLFEDAPVSRAVISLVIPTVISQLITVIYNMADTFFIGQIGDPNQVAAVSLCMPMFIFLTGLANLFGIGSASLISRCLGFRGCFGLKVTWYLRIELFCGGLLVVEIAAPFFQPLLLFFIDLAPPFLVRASCIHSSVRQHPLFDCSFFFEMKKGAGSVIL